MLDKLPEYKLKMKKLTELYDHGHLPETAFIESFIPRVNGKLKNNLYLTAREMEVIDQMFDQY